MLHLYLKHLLHLHRKLLRELWQLKGQMLSIALVVATGVMTVLTMRGTFGFKTMNCGEVQCTLFSLHQFSSTINSGTIKAPAKGLYAPITMH